MAINLASVTVVQNKHRQEIQTYSSTSTQSPKYKRCNTRVQLLLGEFPYLEEWQSCILSIYIIVIIMTWFVSHI